jgi:hypothetical protein
MLRRLSIVIALLAAGCRPADPERMLGRWENDRESVEFFADGSARLRTPERTMEGTYGRVSGARVRVVLGGAPGVNTFYARLQGERLDLCTLRSYRHCIQYHRPGRSTPLVPR